ncbi:MAG TPA: hypothetical protein VNR67_00015 [Solirubrobacterales bacterium]|nr:hypothetical protein [Solirubrobacterales bacterium]
MIVALIALFAALGGSAYAAKKIGTKEIKANAITTGKIKKNAITTAKIKKEAVTGAKIKETTLGAVPNATHATTADTATNAVNAQNFAHYFTSGVKTASQGQTVPLLTIGPFTMVGKCTDGGSGYSEAITILTTSQVASFAYSYDTSYYEADFNPGTELELGYEVSDNSPYIAWEDQYPYYTGFWAASPDGKTVLHGDAVNAVNVFGAQCAFWVDGTNAA